MFTNITRRSFPPLLVLAFAAAACGKGAETDQAARDIEAGQPA